MAKERSFSIKKQSAFLAAYVAAATVRLACKAAGISTALHYWWLEKDPTYGERFKAVQLLSCVALEEEARRRAFQGVRKYKFTAKGEAILHPVTSQPYYEHVYSDGLLAKLLEANNPEKFGKKVEATVSGSIQHDQKVTVYLPSNGREANLKPVVREQLVSCLNGGTNGNGNGAN